MAPLTCKKILLHSRIGAASGRHYTLLLTECRVTNVHERYQRRVRISLRLASPTQTFESVIRRYEVLVDDERAGGSATAAMLGVPSYQ